MSDSYPTIQDSLSDVQKEFMGCVEMHLDPPEHDDPSYVAQAVFRYEPAEPELSGECIRFTVSVAEGDPDISERRHAIEFTGPDGTVRSWVRHRMKRIEAAHGRYFWTESSFEVRAPGLPDGRARGEEVEREVRLFLDKVRTLDRERRLTEVAA